MFQARNSLEDNKIIASINSQRSLYCVPTAMFQKKKKPTATTKLFFLSRRGPNCDTRPTPTFMPNYFTSQLCTRGTVVGRQVRAVHCVNTCDVWLPQ